MSLKYSAVIFTILDLSHAWQFGFVMSGWSMATSPPSPDNQPANTSRYTWSYDCFCCSYFKPSSFFWFKASRPPTFFCYRLFVVPFLFSVVIDDLFFTFFSSGLLSKATGIAPHPHSWPTETWKRQLERNNPLPGGEFVHTFTIRKLYVIRLKITSMLIDQLFTWLVIDKPQGHCLHLLFPSCPKSWVIIQPGSAPSVDNCIHIVVDHHEGSCYLVVWSHEGQALKLSIVWAPGSGEARSVSFTVVE